MVQKKLIFFFYRKNWLRPRDLINVIGTEILRSVAEIMDREFEKKWSQKINFLFLEKNCLRPRDLINVIGTEILRSVAEIMDREFEKNGPKKLFLFMLNI